MKMETSCRLMIVGLLLNFISTGAFGRECVPAREEIAYPKDAFRPGMFLRVHPSGDYVLMSSAMGKDGAVQIFDLKERNAQGEIIAKVIKTKMIAESYPVEGTWTLIASPTDKSESGEDGMAYYRMDQVIKLGEKADPVFVDPKHNEWYHSSAELPGSTPTNLKFRTMLFSHNRSRDYELTLNSEGKVIKQKIHQTMNVCHNRPTGEDGDTWTLKQPILSKDGTELMATDSTSGSSTTKIFKIKNDGSCEEVEDLGFNTGKGNFSYPELGKKGKIAFAAKITLPIDGKPVSTKGTFVYDRDTKEKKRIAVGNASYPGFTKDGRVIYISSENAEPKIVIVDPNQFDTEGRILENPPKCITKNTAKDPRIDAPAISGKATR